VRWPWRRTQARPTTVPVRRVATWAEAALPPDVDAEAPTVQLGFADGSSLGLPAEDPRARALRAIADSLVQDAPAASRGSTAAGRS
jgi:hypothetical protein